MTEHAFAVLAAAKHSDLLSIYIYIGSSMNTSQWYQAININDNRLHLIEVFREAVL